MDHLGNSLGSEQQSAFQVHSRREIISILESIRKQKSLIRMSINSGSEIVITAILDVNEDRNLVVLDGSKESKVNQHLTLCKNIQFDTDVDKIRIIFSSNQINLHPFEGRESLRIDIPTNMIRLQRREFYRINTPLTNPVYCHITLPKETGSGNHAFPLVDISCGGIAILDDKRLLNSTVGTYHENCRIDLFGSAITTALTSRNSFDMSMLNGKTSRRIGLQFTGDQKGKLSIVQRFIMKLERERNSKMG